MRNRLICLLVFLTTVLAACGGQLTPNPESTVTDSTSTERYTYAGKVAAPDFPAGLDWLNTDRPLSLAQDLRGKIVLLDFWTLGCINCIHIIPDLKRLEAEFADSLVVIGVHSAKFRTEGETESIRQAVLRYGLEHPVVNDRNMIIWQTFGANAWPTTFLIDPLGNAVGIYSGEGVYDVFQPIIATMSQEFAASEKIDTRPLERVLESKTSAPTVLSFPGKVLADAAGDRLFIADSNHNRVLVANIAGELQVAIGSGAKGFEDGDFASATFFRPQGMALSADGNTLYIADLENHAVRAADLAGKRVTTVAGTGQQARAYPGGQPGLETELSSPWDLLLAGDRLYIAMAGVHQLWVLDLTEDSVNVFVGSGREGIDDGAPSAASLSQPSGFTTDGKLLYFTDPEASAIRSVPLDGSGKVQTIIGTGLFDFGDVDGSYPQARLQHALGVAYREGRLYVADTYNHKIKIIDPVAKTSQTWIGTGEIGWQDGPGAAAKLAEPSGLSVAGDKLYIADTNNHLIRVADFATGEIGTLALSNLEVAMRAEATGPSADVITLDPQTVSAGEGTLDFIFSVPEHYKFNDLGPFTLSWMVDDENVVQFTGSGDPLYRQKGPQFPVIFPVKLSSGETTLHASATVFYCVTGEEELCLVRDVALEVPLVVKSGGESSRIEVTYRLPEREK